ncbi:hypothetical protein [Alkalihalobacillus sp. AL-G]|uniref:hypothetical protein n=1 Tax=Alkalihalobacillus sp. AL-G TaxID=2926399 RepID=UPI00272C3D70|nr:hypothetical protein [Alkalihalobacillus sp. AL-G]WLD92426.1 hypothetical protein MOJ78_15585 [Alkalihalobacillus sp. AL-G]
MAQLLKLEDCVSRYESDVFRYTGQYIRLKRDRWKRVKTNWQNRRADEASVQNEPEETVKEKKWWQKKVGESKPFIEDIHDMDSLPDFEELKEKYKRELYQFQLKWASSTLREKSPLTQSNQSDPYLKFLLTELPDNYLVLYKPVVQLKQAATQLEVILIGPDSIHCLVFLDLERDSIVSGLNERFWRVEGSKHTNQLISPVPAIQRMNYFIDTVIDHDQLNMKINYTLVAKKGFVDNDSVPSYIKIVDRRTFEEWHSRLKRQPSPIKFTQLKAAKAMLDHCIVTAYHRPEWDSDSEQWFSSPSD